MAWQVFLSTYFCWNNVGKKKQEEWFRSYFFLLDISWFIFIPTYKLFVWLSVCLIFGYDLFKTKEKCRNSVVYTKKNISNVQEELPDANIFIDRIKWDITSLNRLNWSSMVLTILDLQKIADSDCWCAP